MCDAFGVVCIWSLVQCNCYLGRCQFWWPKNSTDSSLPSDDVIAFGAYGKKTFGLHGGTVLQSRISWGVHRSPFLDRPSNVTGAPPRIEPTMSPVIAIRICLMIICLGTQISERDRPSNATGHPQEVSPEKSFHRCNVQSQRDPQCLIYILWVARGLQNT